MMLDEFTGLVKYAGKRFLEQYQWKRVFEKRLKMFHRVKNVKALPNFILQVDFINGISKHYDVKPLFKLWEPFTALQTTDFLFDLVKVDAVGYGIS